MTAVILNIKRSSPKNKTTRKRPFNTRRYSDPSESQIESFSSPKFALEAGPTSYICQEMRPWVHQRAS